MSSNACYQKKLQVLLGYKENLESVLLEYDFTRIVKELSRTSVLEKRVKDELDSLDHDHLDADLKVRYLLQIVYEKIDENVYDRLVRGLNKLGGHAKSLSEAMRKENKDEGDCANVFFTDKDVPALTDGLVSGCHKWEEIGLALGLPEYVRDDCRSGSSNLVRLSRVLTAWIQGGHDGNNPPTLHTLKATLTGKIVGLPSLTLFLDQFSFLPGTSQLTSRRDSPEIIYCSTDTEVIEGSSTLLEVQVRSTVPVNYQWMKNGKVISDTSRFSGISSSILYVAQAGQQTQGKYSCSITCGTTTSLSCEEFILKVRLSEEKRLLLNHYLHTNKLLSQESWPPVSGNMFCTLILRTKVMEHKEQYTTIPGDIEKVMEKKEKISYEEAFSKVKEGSLVLVEGTPGSGKTTLVHKLVNDWVMGKSVLINSKLLFLFSLRTLKFSDALTDYLSAYYNNADFCNIIVKDIERSNGMHICFVLDGLDECPFRNKEESIIYKLLFKKYLSSSVVIVTSRPVALTRDLTTSGKKIEVVGFTKENTLEYINNYPFQSKYNSKDNTVASDLIAYVKTHVNVLHMCYLPLHTAIVCFLFNEQRGNIPSTETLIYEQFAIATILRKMNREKKETLWIKSLKTMDDSIREEFLKVCSLAFDMTINSYPVVSKETDNSGSDDFSLGLLTVQQTSNLHGTEDSYAFHHLSIQEYLAAYHITELEEYEQNLALKEYGGIRDFCNMWKFYFGIKKFDCTLKMFSDILTAEESGCSNIIQYAFESQQVNVCSYVVERNRGTFSFDCDSLMPSDFFAINYILSTSLYHVLKLEFVDCEFDKNSIMCLEDDALKFVKTCSYSKDDYELSNIEALNCLLKKLSSLEVLDIRCMDLNETGIISLTKNITLRQLQTLKLGTNLDYSRHDILKLLRFHSKKIVQVYIEPSSVRQMSVIKNAICHFFGFEVYSGTLFPSFYLYNKPNILPFHCYESYKTYVEIVLVNCNINDQLAKTLADGFNGSPCLMTIELDFNQISDSGAVTLADSIATLNKISVVSFQCNSIGDSGAIVLASCIGRCCTLRKFDLQGNLLGDKGALAIAKASRQLSQLQVYLCNVCVTKEGVKKVLEYNENVCMEETLSESFSWNAIAEGHSETFISALKCGKIPVLQFSECELSWVETCLKQCYLKNLKAFKLISRLDTRGYSGNTCSTCCEGDLSNILKCISTVEQEHLFLTFQNIVDINWTNFISTISLCHNLHTLRLSACKIDSTYMPSLFEVLKYFKHLKRLDLSSNDITTFDLLDLCMHCGDIVELDLSGNNIVFCESSDEITNMTVQVLDLSFNELNSSFMLNKLLMHCSNLLYLNLSGNSIGSSIDDLVDGLTHSITLQRLELDTIDIGCEGITALTKIISHNINLEVVDLSGNEITGGSTKVLSEAFKKCSNLKSLNLSNNVLSVEGLSCLLDNLRFCTNLNSLNLSNIGLDENGATLLDDFQCGISLYELNLSCNKFNSNNELQYLEGIPEELLNSITFEPYGFKLLANGLQFCSKLQHLRLAEINIDKKGTELLANCLTHCHTLKHLDLSRNPLIGSEGAAILVERLQSQSELTLYFRYSTNPDCTEALFNGESCCSSCKKLLSIYYSIDLLLIVISRNRTIPKLVSLMEI